MSPQDMESEDGSTLERFDDDWDGPQETVSTRVTGLWWNDEETGETGQFSVEVEYQPDEWLVYPESLVLFLRQYSGVETRPEPVLEEVWKELSELLFGAKSDADGQLYVKIDAETPADSYSVRAGGIK